MRVYFGTQASSGLNSSLTTPFDGIVMTQLSVCQLFKLLKSPLSKRIDQTVIEEWASNLWKLPQMRPDLTEDRAKDPFVMMFPPPNITGNLHLGHALTGAIQDALIRQRRMQGNHCIFIPGFDHAGLATQNIVEKQLWKNQGITRQQLGREKFTELVNGWKDKKRVEMRDQLKRLGLDLNHEKEYFTMDDNSSLAVQAAFKQLFNAGVIYRSTKPIFWSESLQTTLSDIEVEQIDGEDRFTRTGEIVTRRPFSQWFINAKEMAKQAVEALENSSIEIIPENYKNSWSSWLTANGVQDWCISRQSWWGHRIPAYRVAQGEDIKENWIVADSYEEARSTLGKDIEVFQDPDVLDTWFSSSLLPLTVSGWPNTEKFSQSCIDGHFPLQMMETGFDILTFWVSKMAMVSLTLVGRIPFRLVLLHGMICDSHGKKMSKSRGNVIDPLDVIDGASLKTLQSRTIEAHAQGILDEESFQLAISNQKRLFPSGIPACGADGLRAYLLSHDFQEEIVRVRIDQIDKIRRLSNKIWNVFRFYFMLIDEQGYKGGSNSPNMDVGKLTQSKLDISDQQVLSSLSVCVSLAHKSFNDTYSLHQCFAQLESFIVVDLSKRFLERSKNILLSKQGDQKHKEHKIEVFAICLMESLKLLHPFMPHLSEFLYQKLMISQDKPDMTYKLLSYASFPSATDWETFKRMDSSH